MAAKRSSCAVNPVSEAKKTTFGGVECSLINCEDAILPSHSSVEVKASFTSRKKRTAKLIVSWKKNGEGLFHRQCWDSLLKNARIRNRRNATLILTDEEKGMIKEANKTAEYHDDDERIIQCSKQIAELMCKAKHCVVFTGAGISTSAGIGDFRGKSGKWTEEDRQKTTTTEAEEEEEEEEGVPYGKLKPTLTHNALKKLIEAGLVKHIITQNGDGLHRLSGVPVSRLSELHGNVFLEKCEICNYQYYRSFYVLDDDANQYYEDLSDGISSPAVQRGAHGIQCTHCGLCHRTGRRCDQQGCHGYLKDSIINFGDDLDEDILLKAETEAKSADLFLSLGTTMQVTPACHLVLMGKAPLRLIIINRQKTEFDRYCERKHEGQELGVRVFGDCDTVMEHVMQHLTKLGSIN